MGVATVRSMDERDDADREGGLHLSIRDEHGAPLAARVRVSPRELLTPPSSRIVDGDGRIGLPEGDYHVSVTHGPRHTCAAFTLHVRGGDEHARVLTLREELPLPDHLCVDLHTHTPHSEDAHAHGGVTERALAAEGLDLTLATDHNHAGAMPGKLPGLSGIEVTTWAPEFGHFNAFPVHSAPRYARSNPRALFAALHAQGDVFVQVNHPRLDDHIAYFKLGALESSRFGDPRFTLSGVDGVEVFNGYDIARAAEVHTILTEVAGLWEAGHRLTATGGSDGHGRPGHVPGYPRTCVRTRDAHALARVLRRGDAFVTNGPLIDLRVQGATPGSSVHPSADGSVEVEVAVRTHAELTPDSVEIWAGQTLAARFSWRADDGLFRAHVRVQVQAARSVHARVRGGSGLAAFVERRDAEPLAFTNPVYLERAPRVQSVQRGAAH